MRAEKVSDAEIGYFEITAKPPNGAAQSITMFRDAPVGISQFATADPFTDVTLSLALPQVTVFDKPGYGDLDWLVEYASIDVVWQNTGIYNYDWRFEGFIVASNFSLTDRDSSYTVECKGALYLLDNYIAKPAYPSNPIPYELLIKRAFDQDEHPAHLGRMRMEFPEGWDTTVPAFDDPQYYHFLKPSGVKEGDKWTGLTSRSTGSWDYLLTGYVQGLLSVMYDAGGSQWTIRKDVGRNPVLYLREIPAANDPSIIVIDLLSPGVSMSGSRDFTQSANIIFGSGTDTAGIVYSGMKVSNSGRSTDYEPFAYSSHVFPTTHNPSFNKNVMAKQINMQFPSGLDEVAARRVAEAQLQRFADPGITGSITLTSDVVLNDGTPYPAILIKGGRTCLLKGLFGAEVLVHITQSNVNIDQKTVTLTYDSKYRDQLTVSEVQARTRDAMTPLRALQVGKYSNTIQDLLLPWSYREGSGMVPTASKGFYSNIPDHITWPYEEWTRKHPPSDPSSQRFYVRMGKADRTNASNNWAGELEDLAYQSSLSMYRQFMNSDHPDDGAPDHVVLVTFNDNAPSSPAEHDVWVKPSGVKQIWTGHRWQDVHSPGLAVIIFMTRDIRPLTGTDMRIYYQSTAPASPINGDVWIQRPSGNVQQRRGGGWVASDAFDPPIPRTEGIPVRMSQAGTIRLSQFAAYDKDGNVKPVRFHVSVYNNTVTSGSMPRLYKLHDDVLPRYLHPPGGDNYKTGQRMPFFEGAFESVQPNGEDSPDPPLASAELVIGWGNYFEPAGCWPGRWSRSQQRTGLLKDEATWGWDLTSLLSKNDRGENIKDKELGLLYAMIYCDDDDDDPTFFMGRFYRQEAGAG